MSSCQVCGGGWISVDQELPENNEDVPIMRYGAELDIAYCWKSNDT